MKIRFLAPFIIIILLTLTACAARASAPMTVDSKAMSADSYAMEAAPMPAAEAPMMAEESNSGFSGGNAVGVERIVIKNASLSIVVADPAASMDRISKLADNMGGWVVTSNLYKTTTDEGIEIPQANIQIRVPATELNSALATIKAEVVDPARDVISENVSGQDVTSEYTDLTSRKNNLERAEIQLQEILDNATKTEDVLNVFNQLTQVRSEIEVLKGQIKYYEESATYSAIDITLISQESIKPLTVAGWQPQGVARDAVQALVDTLKVVVNVLIYLIILVLPILIILFFVGKFFIWVFKKIFIRKKKAKQPDKSENPVSQKQQ